ncbi:hypothetical protein KIN20_009132 [Parelaphostrongylus tenuis]|uniref:Actin n=1 Tax=Parelaphostrongylus tenuis TaxID=148309 RepID=A0AAD5MRE4_PARTN|nr:hypothetical protein KIN20_009132 [Parelaphostrongylus tenuis]
MFEKYDIPAFFPYKSAVLTAFANGRTSGLVVDSGATQTSAVPVYDGHALTHAVVRSPIDGDIIYRRKEEVNENEAPRWTKRKGLPEVTKSYDKFMKKQILEDMAISILQLCDTPFDVEYAEKLPSAPYSFPNGFTGEFLAERMKIPESLFDLKYLRNALVAQSTLLNVTQIATTAVECVISTFVQLYTADSWLLVEIHLL